MKKFRKKHNLFMGLYAVLMLLLAALAFNCSPSKETAENIIIELPEASYQLTPDSLPFSFQLSELATLRVQKNRQDEYFCDIIYPQLQAQLYCTWHKIVPENFYLMSEESRKMAFQHTAMATAINEDFYSNDFARVYALIYDIKGEVATPLQLALTDSVSYFFNASLYFNTHNNDSINALLPYLRADVVHLVETFSSVSSN